MKKYISTLGIAALSLTVHAATLPFSHDFSSGWGDMSVVDGNNDGTKFILSQYMGYNYTQGASYTASASNAADEWLFTPVFDIEAGLTYEISFKAKSSTSNTTNELSVAIGPEATPGAMTVIDGSTVSLPYAYSFSSHSFTFTAAQSGSASFGFHLTSPAAQGTFYLDDIEISAGVNGKTPMPPAVSEPRYSVVDGKLNVHIDVTAPTHSVDGSELSEPVLLTGTRVADGYTSTATSAGSWTFADPDGKTSSTEYRFIASNGAGASEAVSVMSAPTVSLPAPVSGLTVSDAGNGAFSLSWQPVTEGVSPSGIFLPSEVTYTVSCNNTAVERGITGTTFDYQYPMPEEGQKTVVFTVIASNSRGTGDKATSETFLVGMPYTGEFAESGIYANYRASFDKQTWTVEGNASAWATSTGSSYSPVVTPQDGDGALINYNAHNGDALLLSPVLDISAVDNAMLKFYVYHYPSGTPSTVQAGFRTSDGTDIMIGEPVVYNDKTKDEGWHEYILEVPAEALTATTRIIFKGVSNGSYGSMYIDNISIKSYLADNLAITGLDVPKSAAIGDDITISAHLLNKGVNTAKDYSLLFEIEGEEAGVITEVPEMAAQSSSTLSLTVAAHPKHGGNTVCVTAKVIYAIDLDMADNSSEAFLPVEANEHPVVTGLKGSATEEGVTLTWTAPEVSDEPTVKTVTESFEDWDSYSTSAPENSGWIFIDNDGGGQYGFNGHNGNTKFAAIVGENYTPSYGNSFTVPDGSKALVMTKPYSYGGSNDNWVILPEVKGGTEFSFSTSATHSWNTATDNIEVYYSMGSTDPEEFLRVSRFEVKTWEWRQYSFTLPAAARRVAFRTNGTMDNDAIAIDAVSYCVEDAPLNLTGYNIYRNHVKAGSTGAAATEFTDAAASNARETRCYYVTAVYDKGESMPSESVDVDLSTGIDNIASGNSDISASVSGNTITVTGAEGLPVLIADAAGRKVFATSNAAERLSVDVASGVYIVKAGDKAMKVAL